VDDLRRDGGDIIRQFWENIKILPDLERECSAIYKLSAKTSVTLLTFDRLDLDRLRDFYNLLAKIKSINDILTIFKTARFKFKCKRLRNIVSMQGASTVDIVKEEVICDSQSTIPQSQTTMTQGNKRQIKLEDSAFKPKVKKEETLPPKKQPLIEPLFPEINSSIAEFEALIVWHTGPNNERIPEPFSGIDPDYD
jgi:hypothetical protein